MNDKENILDIIQKHGAQNLRFLMMAIPLRKINFFGTFIMGYSSSSDKLEPQIFRITEDRYKVSDGYKIQFKPEDQNFGKEAFYITDLNSLIHQGSIRIFFEL